MVKKDENMAILRMKILDMLKCKNYKFLGNIDDIKNTKSLIKYLCACGKITEKTINDFYKLRNCINCIRMNSSNIKTKEKYIKDQDEKFINDINNIENNIEQNNDEMIIEIIDEELDYLLLDYNDYILEKTNYDENKKKLQNKFSKLKRSSNYNEQDLETIKIELFKDCIEPIKKGKRTNLPIEFIIFIKVKYNDNIPNVYFGDTNETIILENDNEKEIWKHYETIWLSSNIRCINENGESIIYDSTNRICYKSNMVNIFRLIAIAFKIENYELLLNTENDYIAVLDKDKSPHLENIKIIRRAELLIQTGKYNRNTK